MIDNFTAAARELWITHGSGPVLVIGWTLTATGLTPVALVEGQTAALPGTWRYALTRREAEGDPVPARLDPSAVPPAAPPIPTRPPRGVEPDRRG